MVWACCVGLSNARSAGSINFDGYASAGIANQWIAATVVAAVHDDSPYRLVAREVTDQPLPAGVEIYEYCLCAKPWDRVFHALFADTD